MWMHIFILLGNTDILSYGSTKSDDIDLWLIFFQQGGPFSIFKGCKIEGQHESHPILSPDISNWRFCQDKSTHNFLGDNFDFFKVKFKVKGQQGSTTWPLWPWKRSTFSDCMAYLYSPIQCWHFAVSIDQMERPWTRPGKNVVLPGIQLKISCLFY